nr:MAG TPA: hypothetical protein [Bacteriophage sp.]
MTVQLDRPVEKQLIIACCKPFQDDPDEESRCAS